MEAAVVKSLRPLLGITKVDGLIWERNKHFKYHRCKCKYGKDRQLINRKTKYTIKIGKCRQKEKLRFPDEEKISHANYNDNIFLIKPDI